VKVQKSWVYLEPIYTQDDVVANLRDQKKVFEDVDKKYKKTMSHHASGQFTAVQEFCRSEGFVTLALKMIDQLEYLDKSLTHYLDSKRAQFARLYFASNEELIGLMGNLSDKDSIQRFMSKLFDGIAGLIFDGDAIVGFYSSSREQLFFSERVMTSKPPEIWLGEVELGMKKTLYMELRTVLQNLLALGPSELHNWICSSPSG
jgi:dynein heavy chain